MSQQAELNDAFHLHCGAKGYLTFDEVILTIRGLGSAPGAAEVKSAGASDKTDLNTFLSVAAKFARQDTSSNEALFEALRSFDNTGEGTIPAKEFANFAQILGEQFNQAEVDALLSHASNGKIDYERLAKKMTSA